MKKLSHNLEDQSLMDFVFQTGEYLLEAIRRKSIIFEMNGETNAEEMIDFGDLLEQYRFDDILKKAEPGDFM